MRPIFVLLLVLTSCASGPRTTRIGQDLHAIDCDRDCFEAAQELCPNGFETLEPDGEEMLIRCRSY